MFLREEEEVMGPNDRYKINPKITHETIEGEVVIVNLHNGNYYSLDKLGADVWCLIEMNLNIGEIINEISLYYDCGLKEIENAISQLISELMNEELIIVNSDKTAKSDVSNHPQFEKRIAGNKNSFEKPFLQKYTDMQDLLVLDPIHEVDEMGWPNVKKEQN
jgi:hypothetical protein